MKPKEFPAAADAWLNAVNDMADVLDRRCENCTYFRRPSHGRDDRGDCYRYPPTVSQADALAVYPTVGINWYCGEWSDRDD